MPTLVAEDGTGLATSNSYCTLDEADTYHEGRLHVSTWTSAGDDDKETALIWATRLLDELVVWDGLKYTEDQALLWPRDGCLDRGGYEILTSVVPQFVKDATAELARYLIGADRTAENDTRGFKYLRAGTLEMEISKYDRAGVLPDSVWNIVRFCATKAAAQTRFLKRA